MATKSSAVSSSSDATMPMTFDAASVACGPMRSTIVPVTGPSRTPGSENDSPNNDTSPGVASNS